MELTKQQKRIVKIATSTPQDQVFVVLETLGEVEKQVNDLSQKIDDKLTGISEELKKKSEEELSYALTEEDKAELKGAAGADYVLTEQDKTDIAHQITVPVVEKVIEKTQVIKEQPIVTNQITNEIKEVAMTDNPDEIASKLNETESSVDMSVIKGLTEEIKRLEKIISTKNVRGARSSNSTKFYDLSSQTNGSLKVFSVPKNLSAIVLGSDFPTILMENNGFTLNRTRTQLTLTTVNAPSQGSQLLFQYTSIFN